MKTHVLYNIAHLQHTPKDGTREPVRGSEDMYKVPQDNASPSDEPAHSKRSPTAEHKQGLGEVAPQLIAKHDFRANGRQDLAQTSGSVIPAPASQHTARPLIKVEEEAVSTLMSLRQVPRKPVTHPPAHQPAATSDIRPLWLTAGPSGGRQDHEGVQLRQADQHHDLAYLGRQNGPGVKNMLPRVNEPRDRARAAGTTTQRLQHERMAVVQHSVARANVSAVPAQVQANRTTENRQAAPSLRGPYAQRAGLPHGQQNLLDYQNSLLVDPTRAATALTTRHARQAQSHATATQQYQAAIAALAGLRYGQPRPPTIAGPPTVVQHAYQQPIPGTSNAYVHSRPPQFAAAPYSHQQSYITPHHLQSYALQQPQPGLGPYPTQAQILLHLQRQRRYFDALRRRRAHYAKRVLTRPATNYQVARTGPFYTPLPTFFGAQFLARGRPGRNSAASLPPRYARTAASGAINSTTGVHMSSARSKGPIHPLSDPQAQADHMKRWEKGHFAYWTRHGRLASDSDGDLLARALPDVVLDPEDEVEAEGYGGCVEEEG